MISVHLKKLRHRVEISPEEEQAIRAAVSEVRDVSADDLIIRSGEELNSSTILVNGWAARTKDLPSGERQVTELHVVGDFLDLHGYTLKCLDHDVLAVTDCTLAVIPHRQLKEIMERYPRLARAFWFSTNVHAAITRELALSLGQRTAQARMAHLFCELRCRLKVVDRAKTDVFDFPLTQRELSECLGLTVVHVNRTLQALRGKHLVEFENRRVRILDRGALEGLAEFDPSYLYLDRRQL
jgi:CRP-like cAMP-binding protein